MDDWMDAHVGPGHRRTIDEYRAECSPPGVCRRCGAPPAGRRLYYCSDECREAFEGDHFWSSARSMASRRYSVYAVAGRAPTSNNRRHLRDGAGLVHERVGVVCPACGDFITTTPQVNHRDPLNGDRYFFSCAHHQENLEPLHPECHAVVTAEQRRVGLIRGNSRYEATRARRAERIERARAQGYLFLDDDPTG